MIFFDYIIENFKKKNLCILKLFNIYVDELK